MRYFIRAVKQFIYTAVVFIVVIGLLYALKIVNAPDIPSLFRNGYRSLLDIALFLAAISAIYPKFGYMSRNVIVKKEIEDDAENIINTVFESFGYIKTESTEKGYVFRPKSAIARFLGMFEDRITVTHIRNGISLEGRRRDLARILSRIEYRLGGGDDN